MRKLFAYLFLGLADNAGGYEGAYFANAFQTGIEKVRITFLLGEGISEAKGRSLDHGICDNARTRQDGSQAQTYIKQSFQEEPYGMS